MREVVATVAFIILFLVVIIWFMFFCPCPPFFKDPVGWRIITILLPFAVFFVVGVTTHKYTPPDRSHDDEIYGP